MELVVHSYSPSPISIEAPSTLREAIELIKSSLPGSIKTISLLFCENGEWTPIDNDPTYQNMLAKAKETGKKKIELRANDPDHEVIEKLGDSISMGSRRDLQPIMTIFYRIMKEEHSDDNKIGIYEPGNTLLYLSRMIVERENIGQENVCAFYTDQGNPLTGSLTQLETTQCHEVITNRSTLHIFIVPLSENVSQAPLDPTQGPKLIEVKIKDQDNLQVHVDLSGTVLDLKRKIYALTQIPPTEIHLKANSVHMHRDDMPLSFYKVQEGTCVKLVRLPCESAHGTYKPGSRQSIPQTEKGLRNLHSFLYTFAKTDFEYKDFLANVRHFSRNCTPLLHSLAELKSNKTMSSLDSIALEEGFIVLIRNMMSEIYPDTEVQPEKLLEHSIEMCALLLEIGENPNSRQEEFREMDAIEPLNLVTIKKPVHLKPENAPVSVYDKSIARAKIERNEEIPGIRDPAMQRMNIDEALMKKIKSCKLNGKDSTLVWVRDYTFFPINTQDLPRWSDISKIASKHKLTSMIHPLKLKDPENRYYMTLNKDQIVRINEGITPCSVNKVELIDILTQEAENVEVNELGRVLEASMLQGEQFVITREPSEAIVVVFDTSSSMGNSFETDFSRLAATTQFFENFSDRTIGYRYNHVISLILFSTGVKEASDFTENASVFVRKIHGIVPGGKTRLCDAILAGISHLQKISYEYPHCRQRILCLSDGEENCSQSTFLEVSEALFEKKIVLDCIVVGELCNKLKAIALASGGCAILPSSVKKGITLFENEAFLALKNRESVNPTKVENSNQLAPFIDMPISIKPPSMTKPSQIQREQKHPNVILEKAAIQYAQVPNRIRYKRIMRELKLLTDYPHPNIDIFPTEDGEFWNVYIEGPNDSPYAGGFFHMFLKFGDNYPHSPPEARFITPIYHCNISSTGRICHSILNEFYRVDVTVKMILNYIYGLLIVPEHLDPLDANRASELQSHEEKYYAKAMKYTQRFAVKTTEEMNHLKEIEETIFPEFLDPISKKIMDDPVIFIGNGNTYERAEIERVIEETGLDPLDGTPIDKNQLVSNKALKKSIEDYKKKLQTPQYNQ